MKVTAIKFLSPPKYKVMESGRRLSLWIRGAIVHSDHEHVHLPQRHVRYDALQSSRPGASAIWAAASPGSLLPCVGGCRGRAAGPDSRLKISPRTCNAQGKKWVICRRRAARELSFESSNKIKQRIYCGCSSTPPICITLNSRKVF